MLYSSVPVVVYSRIYSLFLDSTLLSQKYFRKEQPIAPIGHNFSTNYQKWQTQLYFLAAKTEIKARMTVKIYQKRTSFRMDDRVIELCKSILFAFGCKDVHLKSIWYPYQKFYLENQKSRNSTIGSFDNTWLSSRYFYIEIIFFLAC